MRTGRLCYSGVGLTEEFDWLASYCQIGQNTFGARVLRRTATRLGPVDAAEKGGPPGAEAYVMLKPPESCRGRCWFAGGYLREDRGPGPSSVAWSRRSGRLSLHLPFSVAYPGSLWPAASLGLAFVRHAFRFRNGIQIASFFCSSHAVSPGIYARLWTEETMEKVTADGVEFTGTAKCRLVPE